MEMRWLYALGVAGLAAMGALASTPAVQDLLRRAGGLALDFFRGKVEADRNRRSGGRVPPAVDATEREGRLERLEARVDFLERLLKGRGDGAGADVLRGRDGRSGRRSVG